MIMEHLVQLWLKWLLLLIAYSAPCWCSKCNLAGRGMKVGDLHASLLKCDPRKDEHLDLSRNALSTIDLTVLRNFTNLLSLVLDSNNLTKVPENINENLPRLQRLSLVGNEIKQLVLFEAANLTVIDLSGNKIFYLPPRVFSRLPRLRELYLSRNKIQKISRDTFTNLSNLWKLYLDNNEIDSLYSGILKGLNSLQVFSVAHNKLRRIRNGVVTNLRYLNDIYLNGNEISSLDDRSFQRLAIHKLNLQNNRLQTVKDTVFLNALIYGKINIKENPLSCDCWLVEPNISKLRSMGELQGTCGAPLFLKGRSIVPLTRVQLVCKATNSCREHTCQNDALCTHINATFYQCDCQLGYYGDRCQFAIEDSSYTLIIILSVCLGVVLIIVIVIASVIRSRKNRNVHNRCISKESCCCFMILGVFFFLFSLFVGLRVACRFHEYC